MKSWRNNSMKCTGNYSQVGNEVNYERYFRYIWGSYFDPGNRLGRRVIRSLLQQDINTSKVFVDIGGGVGDLCLDAIKDGSAPKSTVLLDLSERTIKMARKYAQTLGIHYSFVVGDAQRLPFKSATVDIACSRESLEHLPDDGVALKELERVLKPGGVAVLTVPFKERRGEKQKMWGHLRSYTLESILSLIKLTELKVGRVVFIGKISKFLWTYPKYIIYLAWLFLTGNLMKRLRGDYVPSYYTGSFHRRIVMPFFDKLLTLDYVFSLKGIAGSGTNLIISLRKS